MEDIIQSLDRQKLLEEVEDLMSALNQIKAKVESGASVRSYRKLDASELMYLIGRYELGIQITKEGL